MSHTGYEIVDFDQLPGVECPCGLARRAFLDVRDFPGTIHRTEILGDAKTHYHQRLTETYYVLQCDAGAGLELDGQFLPVKPGTCILIRPGTLPRTTSGKVRYADVRKQYRDGDLSEVARWSFARGGQSSQQREVESQTGAAAELKSLMNLPPIDDRQTLAVEIETRLLKWLSHAADADAAELDPNRPFADYGLDSLAAVELTGQLEEGLGLKLSPTIAWTFPTAASLARHLAEEMLDEDDGDAEVDEDDGSSPMSDESFDQLLAQLEQMPEDEVAAMLAAQERPEANQ